MLPMPTREGPSGEHRQWVAGTDSFLPLNVACRFPRWSGAVGRGERTVLLHLDSSSSSSPGGRRGLLGTRQNNRPGDSTISIWPHFTDKETEALKDEDIC